LPMSDEAEPSAALDDAFQQHLKAVARYCETRVEAVLEEGRTGLVIPPLVRHLYEVADFEIAQAIDQTEPPIDPTSWLVSCERSATATIPEAITIAEYLRSQLGADELVELTNRLAQTDSSCPFLSGGRCLVHPARPFACRVTSLPACHRFSFEGETPPPQLVRQDAAAHAAEHGLRVGSRFEFLDCEHVHLASAVLEILNRPSFAQDYLEGATLPEAVKARIAQDPVQRFHVSGGARPAFCPEEKLTEPTGYLPAATEKSLREYYDLGLNQGLFRDALKTLRLGGAAQEIAKIVVPRVYDGEEEIAEWRSHFIDSMRAFAEGDFEPGEAFNALSMHRTASLAYQGMQDKEIMVEHGQIMSEITRRAFPELCEPINKKTSGGKIRVGYLSANMHGSNGCRWSLGWLRNHGPEIETFALNVGTVEDEVSRQFRTEAHHYFHLIRSIPDNARFIRSLGLDFLIITDIGLHGFNTSYATMRLARIQATAWGHPVTSGYPTVDLYLSSDLMEPEGAQSHYSEELVRLPKSGLCYPCVESFQTRTRSHFGLPENGRLIVNVQTKPKLLPQHDHLYREIAERAKASIVLLEGVQPCDTIVTKRRLEKAGVPTIWLPHLKRPDFLALLQLADVSLDPPLWSGGNTTVEALALGTPVVTLPGPWMRSRHSFAFLKLANAEGLIASDEADYVALASDFERQREAMREMDADALFDDMTPIRFLDEVLRSRC